MKHFISALFFFLLFFIFYTSVLAASSYVLPYPGIMPGNKLYKAHVIFEEIQKYMYFGDFGQFKYNLSESDKYLVEAKTLFEYDQYPLALKSLQKSNAYFKKVPSHLTSAKKNGKNISEKMLIFKSAKEKHIEVLQEIVKTVPEIFTWQDEKKSPLTLNLHKELKEAIRTRFNTNE